jgi:hypothetical protein
MSDTPKPTGPRYQECVILLVSPKTGYTIPPRGNELRQHGFTGEEAQNYVAEHMLYRRGHITVALLSPEGSTFDFLTKGSHAVAGVIIDNVIQDVHALKAVSHTVMYDSQLPIYGLGHSEESAKSLQQSEFSSLRLPEVKPLAADELMKAIEEIAALYGQGTSTDFQSQPKGKLELK